MANRNGINFRKQKYVGAIQRGIVANANISHQAALVNFYVAANLHFAVDSSSENRASGTNRYTIVNNVLAF